MKTNASRLRTPGRAPRPGYTLIELMVSMALIMFIMAILVQAFTVGVELFSKVKGVHDMAARLWSVSHALRTDLSASHFDGANRISDPKILEPGSKPREGFFRIQQFMDSNTPVTAPGGYPIGSFLEGTSGPDNDQIRSYRVGVKTAGVQPGHVLHFAVRLKGNNMENFFDAPVPVGSPILANTTFWNLPADARYQVQADPTRPLYKSQWAEVCYMLNPTFTNAQPGTVPAIPILTNSDGTGAQQPRYSLHRITKLLVTNNLDVNALKIPSGTTGAWGSGTIGYDRISVKPDIVTGLAKDPLNFNMPNDITVPNNRGINLGTSLPVPVGTDPSLSDFNSPCTSDNTICTDVLSFQVRYLPVPTSGGTPVDPKTLPFGWPIGSADFQDIPGGFYESSDTLNGYSVYALEITIRVWDIKTQQTRQVTIVQDM